MLGDGGDGGFGGMDGDITGSGHSPPFSATTKAILVLAGFLVVFFGLLVLFG